MGLYLEGVGSVTTRYGHLSKVIKVGKVKEGEIIGLSGNSGTATNAPHLHLDLRRNGSGLSIVNFFDPMILLKWKQLEIKPKVMTHNEAHSIIRGLYFAFAKREPDQEGLGYWIYELLNSPENEKEKIVVRFMEGVLKEKMTQGIPFFNATTNQWENRRVDGDTACACAEERVRTQNRVREEIKAKLVKFSSEL